MRMWFRHHRGSGLKWLHVAAMARPAEQDLDFAPLLGDGMYY